MAGSSSSHWHSQVKHFQGAILWAVGSFFIGGVYAYFSRLSILSVLFAIAVLAILEISLSFDNAVVNATTLKIMSPAWQKRFVTWGMLIAVFGMRLLFPIAIVSVTGKINPIQAFQLALQKPNEYMHIISGAHNEIMGFGGAFLLLVGLKFFFDQEKETHWIGLLEKGMQFFGRFEAFEIVLTLLALVCVAVLLPTGHALSFLISGVFGIATFFLVDWIGELLSAKGAVRTGLAAFIYLEILDASFSFDGVIGAFAVSNNLIVIALGLGIGAMFIRSITLSLVQSGTLTEYQYLEHGAFWAILSLACLMFIETLVKIPDVVTGLIGASFISAAYISSVHTLKRGSHVS